MPLGNIRLTLGASSKVVVSNVEGQRAALYVTSVGGLLSNRGETTCNSSGVLDVWVDDGFRYVVQDYGVDGMIARTLGNVEAVVGGVERNSGATGSAASALTESQVLAVVGDTISVPTSRALTVADNGKVLELGANIALTVPIGLADGTNEFGCSVIANGVNTIVSSGGTLLNGAITTVSRDAAYNVMFAIVGRATAANSYVVSGA